MRAAPTAPLSKFLLLAIGLTFGLEELLGGSTDPLVLIRLGALVRTEVLQGEWWRLVTCGFLHIGLVHLLVNGWALYQLGGLYEIWMGSRRFALVYGMALVGGSLASLLWTQSISAGASGAIFGLLGALITLLARRRERLRPAAKRLLWQLSFWAIFNVFFGLSVAGIDNAAHLGGFLAGAAVGWSLRPVSERRRASA